MITHKNNDNHGQKALHIVALTSNFKPTNLYKGYYDFKFNRYVLYNVLFPSKRLWYKYVHKFVTKAYIYKY